MEKVRAIFIVDIMFCGLKLLSCFTGGFDPRAATGSELFSFYSVIGSGMRNFLFRFPSAAQKGHAYCHPVGDFENIRVVSNTAHNITQYR